VHAQAAAFFTAKSVRAIRSLLPNPPYEVARYVAALVTLFGQALYRVIKCTLQQRIAQAPSDGSSSSRSTAQYAAAKLSAILTHSSVDELLGVCW
jgi:hypothetical protein